MTIGYKKIIASPWVRSLVFLGIVYFSQIYPFYHLHHFHDNDDLEIEISSHPLDIDLEHSANHTHEESFPPNGNHQHTYDKHIDWHILRVQNQKTLEFNDPFLFSDIIPIQVYAPECICLGYEEHYDIYTNYFPPSITRGPPALG